MNPALASWALPLLARLDPERAHGLALAGLRLGLAGRAGEADDPILATEAFGQRFANPIGLAAGFDKDAVAVLALMRLGFGFVEAGGVTPRAQAGNPRPRLFRLAEDRAVINRMGMNGRGIEAFVARLARLPERPAVLGVNVAINKEGARPERDYPALVAAVAPHADYVAINVSSPNTPGLRALQDKARLAAILAAIAAQVPKRPPVLVKVAPDLDEAALAGVVETALGGGAAGLIVGNTTTARPAGLRARAAGEAGGLSGAPLYALSTAALARAFRLARGRLILIGCGGVSNGAQALGKICAGASLVQLYTAFAYAGPALVPRIKRELAAALRAGGFSSVAAAVGTEAAAQGKAAQAEVERGG
ncbi:MAG: quinone-dependent dihydroorotate dehydrogenase [Rhodospirillales bacterium]|nr:quinone-dependent dihydroorotate dehydrogenase [Rhodospirillales bacterium]